MSRYLFDDLTEDAFRRAGASFLQKLAAAERPLSGGESEMSGRKAMRAGALLGGVVGASVGAEHGFTQRGGYVPRRLRRAVAGRKAMKVKAPLRGMLKGGLKGGAVGVGLGAGLAGAAHYLGKEKRSSGIQALIKKNPAAAGAIIGAAALTGAQYLANKRFHKNAPSAQEKIVDRANYNIKQTAREAKAEGRKLTFTEEVAQITAKPAKELAELAAKHPVKAALPMAAIGASLGSNIVRIIQSIKG